MSFLTRIANVFRRGRVQAEIDEELADHIRHAIAEGRTAEEAERALGDVVRHREASADIKLAAWLDSLRADTIFGVRQLRRRKTATAAAVISLALAIGAVTAAFRLIDAALLRPLPVKDPSALSVVAFHFLDSSSGQTKEAFSFSYPIFRDFQEAAGGNAEVVALSSTRKADITFGSDEEMEKAEEQLVSGGYFGMLGVQPVLGRVLGPADNLTPGGHPVAVLSHDYWTRRFGRDPAVIGRTFRQGVILYQIVGVAQPGFTGTETGRVISYFAPTMQSAEAIHQPNWQWVRIWVRPKPGVTAAQITQPMQAVFSARRRELVKNWPPGTSQAQIDRYVNTEVFLQSAAAGQSGTQRLYRQPLFVMACVVLLVLLIACANVANLLTAQADTRRKEFALRVSIGAGRARLVQLMLVECLMLAVTASVLGGLFAWWAAPFVVGMINPADDPIRLSMPADWRVLGFSGVLALAVTLLFGLVPALRASRVQLAPALKGGENPHSRRRLMHALVAAQVAFCFVVHFGAGLFVATFDRLTHMPTGFDAGPVLLLETRVKGAREVARRTAEVWDGITARIRETPGVEAVGISSWALMSGSLSSDVIRVAGRTPDDSQIPANLGISPGWLAAMHIPLIDGRDLRPGDTSAALDENKRPVPGTAVVNESFAKKYFDAENPVGKSFSVFRGKTLVPVIIVGYVRDARYVDLRETAPPTFYVPLGTVSGATFTIRAAPGTDPLALAQPLRRLVSATRSDFRVSTVQTQAELVRNQAIRERLLATLSSFFAGVALILAGVGLYGVMHYAVQQRRREIGIRIALGASVPHIARQVSGDVFLMLILGSALGLAAGLLSERYVETLLFGVKATEWTMLAVPLAMLIGAAVVAAIPPVVKAARTDPAASLRAEA